MIDLSAEEMVDWANANMERVEELENTVERLQSRVDELETENAGLVGRNTCLYREIKALEGEVK